MEYLIALIALTAMEIVLGIDNIVFIAILSGQLPESQRPRARQLGLLLAMGTRILLLLTLSWVLTLDAAIFHLDSLGLPGNWLPEEVNDVSWKDLILLGGGLFLIWKSVFEIHKKVEGVEEEHKAVGGASIGGVGLQIGILDSIFSLDPVINAVGMVQ